MLFFNVLSPAAFRTVIKNKTLNSTDEAYLTSVMVKYCKVITIYWFSSSDSLVGVVEDCYYE